MGSPLQIVAKLALTIFVLFLVTETEGGKILIDVKKCLI